MIDCVVNSVKMFQRIESKVYVDVSKMNIFLKPAIPPDFIEECRCKIYQMLENQRIGPELRLNDFDAYLSLMNGFDAERIIKFMNSSPPFAEYCELIDHYKAVEDSIAKTTSGVISMGLYEFHRTKLIETLEKLARFMQTELLTRMVRDQQGEMAQLEAEYEEISERSLAIPKDTAELMASKAFVAKTDNKVIPEMEDRLRVVRYNSINSNTSYVYEINLYLIVYSESRSSDLAHGLHHVHAARDQTEQHHLSVVPSNAVNFQAEPGNR